jgi:hypothetical protein
MRNGLGSSRRPSSSARRRFSPSIESLERLALLTTFFVTNDTDNLDEAGDPLEGTLRWAIVNANLNPGSTIAFAIPGPGVHTIRPQSALPRITAAATIIDGYSQGARNTLDAGDNAKIQIVLDGSLAGANVNGLDIAASACKVQGLSIGNWGGVGIELDGNGYGTIQGNYIGVDPSGSYPLPNVYGGVSIQDSMNNVIGGLTPDTRNVISGNTGGGVTISGSSSNGNTVEGNYVGTDSSGLSAVPNHYGGVNLYGGSNNRIGAANAVNPDGSIIALHGNLISGNQGSGIGITGNSTNNNYLIGNLIGTDRTGETGKGENGSSLGNANGQEGVYGYGVVIFGGASGNHIGEGSPGTGNVISNNLSIGVYIIGSTVMDTVISGNRIGTDVTGRLGLGNGLNGIIVSDAPGTIIGGTFPGAGNVISANKGDGVDLFGAGTTHDLIEGNYIGTDGTGQTTSDAAGHPFGNTGLGIYVGDYYTAGSPTYCTIGGTSLNAANLISGNGRQGVEIHGLGTIKNIVEGNYIGTNKGGTAPLGNGLGGLLIVDASNNTIGGTDSLSANVFSGNLGAGVAITGKSATQNIVEGNYIGTNSKGTLGLGNTGDGVFIQDASANLIGGDTTSPGTAPGNVISGNKQSSVAAGDGNGVHIVGASADSNRIQGNLIGTNGTGTAALPNDGQGVMISDGSYNLVGGSDPSVRNVISGNGKPGVIGLGVGVEITGTSANGNLVQANYLGTDLSGSKSLGGSAGVVVIGATGTRIGDFASTAGGAPGNLISGNVAYGVNKIPTGVGIELNGASGTQIQGNIIGLSASGKTRLANAGDGILLIDASNNNIGKASRQGGNVISGNDGYGIHVEFAKSMTNFVEFNYVGIDITGTNSGTLIHSNTSLGNTLGGIFLDNAPGNTIGGFHDGENVISGNGTAGSPGVGPGIRISGPDAKYNFVEGNYIGTNAKGTLPLGNAAEGIRIEDAFGTDIGGMAAYAGAAPGNVISGNGTDGILITGANATQTEILSNAIGTNAAGTAKIPNQVYGIHILDAPGNSIGSGLPYRGNLISGNGTASLRLYQSIGGGIEIEGQTASGNDVWGNRIGTDITGFLSLGNVNTGVNIEDSPNNVIGGGAGVPGTGFGNLISGNANPFLKGGPGDADGVRIHGFFATGNKVLGNLIGTTQDGSSRLPNSAYGVEIEDASSNTIGSNDPRPGAANVISGNGAAGVYIHSTLLPQSSVTGNKVQGNYIGLDITGGTVLGNATSGVLILHADKNTVGGATASNTSIGSGPGNVISGNGGPATAGDGVYLLDSSGTVVQGNLIGTDVTGAYAVPNTRNGVYLQESPRSLIGGTTPGTRNVISGNGTPKTRLTPASGVGIEIEGSTSTGNQVQNNEIGVNLAGNAGLPNQTHGVYLFDAPSNLIGGPSPLDTNVISANKGAGVVIQGSLASNNKVQGNDIGTNGKGLQGRLSLGNSDSGVFIVDAPNNLIGGAAMAPGVAPGNVISGNGAYGLAILNSSTTAFPASGNKVQGNLIGVLAGGTSTSGNAYDGVIILGSSSNVIGGSGSGTGNYIADNGSNGVRIIGPHASNNVVQSNVIGWMANTTLGNGGSGVLIDTALANSILANSVLSNRDDGVKIVGGNLASRNIIQKNFIAGNLWFGVQIGTPSDKPKVSRTNVTNNIFQGNRTPSIQDNGDQTTKEPNTDK